MDDQARRHHQIQAELGQIGLVLPGSLTDRTTRCQRAPMPLPRRPATARPLPDLDPQSQRPDRHQNPHPQDAKRLRPYFDAHRHLRQLITELEAISVKLAGQPGLLHAQPPAQPGDQPA